MGCFLGCFGSSKDAKKRPKNSQFSSYHNPDFQKQCNPTYPTVTTTVIANQDAVKKPVNLLVSESRVKQEEEEKLNLPSKDELDEPIQLSSGTRKRVTFDTNVKEYQHVGEPQKAIQESEKEVVVEYSIKPITTSSDSEFSESTLSSLGSFPLNHRYQNCRESDDEDGLDCEVSDLDDEEEEEGYDDEYSDDEYHLGQVQEVSARPCASVESKTKSSPTCLVDEEYNNQVMDDGSPQKGTTTPVLFNRGARDRAGYVHSVLNPVENTAQWKTLKVKGTPPLKEEHKENFLGDLPFQQSSTKLKSKLDEPAKNNHEVAVDASLSTWLASSLKTPPSKGSHISLALMLSGSSVSSKGSNSVRSQEERPMMGALKVEEIKQFSATSSPRRSPSRSPDERPIVGTVGVHWKDRTPVEESGSASSFKGIPNSNKKYREDQRVNWHSTPFETRLERALKRGAAKCDATRRAC